MFIHVPSFSEAAHGEVPVAREREDREPEVRNFNPVFKRQKFRSTFFIFLYIIIYVQFYI